MSITTDQASVGAEENVGAPDRRRPATSKLIVVDFPSVFPEWTGNVPAEELIARSVLVRTLAQARRDGDVYLVGTSPGLATTVAELFPGAAIFVDSDDPESVKAMAAGFLAHESTGGFSELVVVSANERFVGVVDAFRKSGRSVTVVSTEDNAHSALAERADVVHFFPDFSDD
ncbi:MAG: hypothetical protein HKN94_06140 [Acidimicrobiales bacterium]|nr:hypothetical protein [Acidimicrobiales bacterium]RZV46300.1 MAG: NYN domain-containing protein [Acidimicrobiales bacterium]